MDGQYLDHHHDTYQSEQSDYTDIIQPKKIEGKIQKMRIVWKDSKPKLHKPVKYRGYIAEGYNGGWTINVPGDVNIYKTHYCALNAIDQHLGGHGQMGSAKRQAYGIKVIGKKDETA